MYSQTVMISGQQFRIGSNFDGFRGKIGIRYKFQFFSPQKGTYLCILRLLTIKYHSPWRGLTSAWASKICRNKEESLKTLYFIHLSRSPLSVDFNQIWYEGGRLVHVFPLHHICRPSRVAIKVKSIVLHKRSSAGAHLSLLGLEPVGGEPLMSVTRGQCDARPMVSGYLPSRRASPPIGWYQIILLGDRGTCVYNLLRVALDSGAAVIQTRNRLIKCPAS